MLDRHAVQELLRAGVKPRAVLRISRLLRALDPLATNPVLLDDLAKFRLQLLEPSRPSRE